MTVLCKLHVQANNTLSISFICYFRCVGLLSVLFSSEECCLKVLKIQQSIKVVKSLFGKVALLAWEIRRQEPHEKQNFVPPPLPLCFHEAGKNHDITCLFISKHEQSKITYNKRIANYLQFLP